LEAFAGEKNIILNRAKVKFSFWVEKQYERFLFPVSMTVRQGNWRKNYSFLRSPDYVVIPSKVWNLFFYN
jgi:hypothetical protein